MTDPFPNLFLLLFTFLYNFFSLFVGQPQLFPLGSRNVASENERWERIKMRCIKIRIRIIKYLNQTNVSFSKEQKGNFGNKMWKPLFNLFHFSFSTFSSINFPLFSAVQLLHTKRKEFNRVNFCFFGYFAFLKFIISNNYNIINLFFNQVINFYFKGFLSWFKPF